MESILVALLLLSGLVGLVVRHMLGKRLAVHLTIFSLSGIALGVVSYVALTEQEIP
jgi:hypothetical protein